MKNYYYDCIHQARYMMKNFNVMFQYDHGAPQGDNSDYIVMKECHSIFDPKDGDIGMLKDGRTVVYKARSKCWWRQEPDRPDGYSHEQPVQTVFRNGLHFFQPKE